jgi:adenylate cyclase
MTQTRRLAAILAADVAGYSRRIGADEGGTLQRLKAIRDELIDPTIATHHGRLVKTTGDGLLIEFGSVIDGLRCVTEIQAGMAERNATVPHDERIEFRMGLNVGDVVVEDGDIFGDGVNIAARLEGLAEPGGICVLARVREDAAGKLDLALEDIGEQQFNNIARSVRVYRVRGNAPAGRPMDNIVQPALALPDKPSVAVLPFTNMSTDPEQEFFADGIAEDVITALSRYPSLFVIARNSCFTYKGRAIDVKEIGRELGVLYVLEGSLRKAGNRIRVTAQLVEAETGKHVWAERYDRDLADIFAVQDEITEAVTIAIAPAIADAEQQRAMRKPPESLDGWAAYQRGLWYLGKTTAAEDALAQQFFQRAIDRDPSFAGGYGGNIGVVVVRQVQYCRYGGLALAQFRGAATFGNRELVDAQRSAEALVRQAVALDAGGAEARSCLGATLQYRGDHVGALVEAGRALEVTPNLALAHGIKGVSLIFSGRPSEGLVSIQTSIRLDPRGPAVPLRSMQVVLALYFSHEYERAVEAANQAIQSFPDFPQTYSWLAAALVSSVGSKRRRRRWRRPLRLRQPPSTCMCATALPGSGRKTMPICWKVCARPDCRRSEPRQSCNGVDQGVAGLSDRISGSLPISIGR